MKILRISSLASFKLLPAIFRVVIILPSKFKESLMHYPWMNFIFHYYLLSFTFKLPSSFWRKKEGVISVEIIIREMKEGGKKEREISASPSQRVWRKKIRFHWILPGTSLFFPRLTFFFIFPPSKRSFFFFFYEQSCTNNYYIISTVLSYRNKFKISKSWYCNWCIDNCMESANLSFITSKRS